MGHRDLSCYCYWPQVCSCSDLKYFELKVMKNTGKDENENRTEILSAEKRKGISVPTTKPGLKIGDTDISDDLLGNWCMVKFNSRAYPGKITNISENDIEIDCMKRNGQNQYNWPIYPDKHWYFSDDILALIPEPVKSGRHYSVSKIHFEKLVDKFDQVI